MLEHNKIVYDEVIERLKTSSRVCIVQATGTGKGVIASSLIEDYVNVLVIAPTNAILENYRMNLGVNSENVIFYTYQGISMLLNNQIEELGEKVSLIILDEFHRIGAETWGRKVEMLCDRAESKGCKTVGLSATPVRYLDNERDMSEEFFKGNVVNGLNIVDAVVSGVLPTFKYVVSYYGYEKDLFEKIEENRNKLLSDVKAIVSNLENNYSIGKIIQKETKELGKNQKWIVFFSRVEELEDFKDNVYSWFNSKVNLFVLHSYSDNRGNMSILKEFNNSSNGINVLLSVNMLNEGVHIKDIDGVIMLRKTISPIVYLQQLGRALQIGGKNPIIFDFIGNYRRMNYNYLNSDLFNFIEEINNGFEKNCVEKDKESVTKKIIINSYCEEIGKILDNITKIISSRHYWLEEEIEIVKKYYHEKGAVWISKNILLNRTAGAIGLVASRLGLTEKNIWSEEEIEVLRKYYVEKGPSWISKNILTHKSRGSINSKALLLGLKTVIKPSEWTNEEIELVKKYYIEKGYTWLHDNCLPNRSLQSIKSKAMQLNLNQTSYDYWTEEEDNILRKYYNIKGIDWIVENNILEKRTKMSIYRRVRILGLKSSIFWTDEEIEILKNNYHIKSSTQIQKELLPHKNLNSIRNKMFSLGLTKKEMRYFTEAEDEIIKQYFLLEGSKVADRLIDRSKSSVRGRAKILGLYK